LKIAAEGRKNIMISKRADKFTSFIVMDVMAKAEELERRGENIIHLEAARLIIRRCI